MKNYILATLLVVSLPLYAQEEEAPVEVTGEAVAEEATPVVSEEVPAEETAEATSETTAEAPAPVAAAPVATAQTVQAEVETERDFNPRENHWYTSFGFEAMEYALPFEYTGAKETIKPENRQLYGARLGFGGELYLGAGFMTSTRLEGYYMGTLFESAKTADPELEDEDVATIKDTGQIYGGDIVQTLSFMWELKTKNPLMDEMTYLMVEPFVEAGIGRAWAYNEKDYSYDSGVIVEEYDQSFTDELTNAKIGGGINFTSRQGWFLTLKVTQNRYDITKRKTKGYYYADNDASPTQIDDPNPYKVLEPIMIYSLGGGYKF